MRAAPEAEASSPFAGSAWGGAGLVDVLSHVAAWAGLVVVGTCAGVAVVVLGLPAMTALAMLLTLGLALGLMVGFRDFPIVGLVFSVPLPIGTALTYRPGHIGSADGIGIALIDCWIVWLLVHFMYLRHIGRVKPLRGLGAFCLPVALLLLADLLSFGRSVDLEMSVAGVVSDARAAVLFMVLAVALAQGPAAVRAGMTGTLWGVLVIGAVCVVQAVLGADFQTSVAQEDEAGYAFRAGGFSVPTSTAGYLAVLLPLVLAEGVQAASPARRRFARLVFAIGLAGLMCTLTRSAMGFLTLGVLPLVLYLLRYRILRVRYLVVGLVVIGALAITLGDRIAARIDEGPDNAVARYGLMRTAVQMARDSPLTGQGVNTYVLRMQEFEEKHQITHVRYLVHNRYLLTLSETGGLGLLAFLWFLAIVLARSLALARRSVFGLALLGSTVVAVLHMNVEPYAGGFTIWNVWVVAGFVAALSGTPGEAAPGFRIQRPALAGASGA